MVFKGNLYRFADYSISDFVGKVWGSMALIHGTNH